MKGQTNYIHIFLAVSIAFIMVAIVTGLAFGVLWYFNNYVEENLDPSKNIITECIGKCQEEAVCETGTVSSYKLINGACSCECAKVKANANINSSTVPDNWQEYTDENKRFTFLYPSNFSIHDDSNDEDIWIGSSENSSLPLINIRISEQTVATYVNNLQISYIDPPSSTNVDYQLSDGIPISDEEITISQQKGRKLVFSTAIGLNRVHYVVEFDGRIYDLNASDDTNYPIFEDIIVAFKLVSKSDENDWQSYTHTNFALQYPSGWEARADISGSDLALETITFSAPEIISDSLWSVLLYSANSTGEDALIAKMGDQFSDRKEIRERITVGGKQATKVTVTTETIIGWQHIQIFLEDSDTLYAINDGAGRNAEFETFYNSFQLINN